MGEVKREFGLYLQLETVYGITRLTASVKYVSADGELLSPGYGPGSDMAQLEVSAYVDRDHGNAWGSKVGCVVAAGPVELRDAESMVAVLRKVDRSLVKAAREQGYLSDGDFFGLVLRVAAALRIRRYWVRNSDRARAMTGQWYRSADGSDVQHWILASIRDLVPVSA